jgi:hypothetical protein
MNTPVIAFFCIGMDPVVAGTNTCRSCLALFVRRFYVFVAVSSN